MMNSRLYRFIAACILAAVLSVACAAAGPSASAPRPAMDAKILQKLIPLVESLYLNSKNLEEIYLDLRIVVRAHAFMPDDLQLGYLQKTALYVQKSLMTARHQWEILSILEDIKPAAMGDYYTLRHKGLQKAIDETGYDLRFVDLYQSYIRSKEAHKDIDRARTAIEKIQAIYTELIRTLAPLARKGLPTTL